MTSNPPKLYKEVRVDLASCHQHREVTVTLPKRNFLKSRSSRVSVAFSKEAWCSATNASPSSPSPRSMGVFARGSSDQPQRIMWMLSEDGYHVLLRPIDILREGSSTHHNLASVRLNFDVELRSQSIVFVEQPDQSSSFELIALGTSHEVLSVQLQASYFRSPESISSNSSDWFHSHTPSTSNFRTPHHLIACNYNLLLVSLHDAGVLILRRSANSDTAKWTESYLNETGWSSSIRNLLSWQGSHTVRYGSTYLEYGTALSLVVLPDQQHIVAVTLDHRLKAWNASSGRITCSQDLLGRERDDVPDSSSIIDVSQSHLIELLDELDETDRAFPGRRFRLLVYSPINRPQFKIWKVDSLNSGSLRLEDHFTNQPLEPRAPSSEPWSIKSFQACPVERAQIFDLWVLWKSAQAHQVHRVRLDLSTTSLSSSVWVCVAEESWLSVPPAVPLVVADSSEQWIHYFMETGRFGTASLLAAAKMLAAGQRIPHNGFSGLRMLRWLDNKFRETSGVADADFGDDSDGLNLLDEQWRRYQRTVLELERRRWEAMELAVDWKTGSPAVLLKAGVAFIRDSGPFELAADNFMEASLQIDVSSDPHQLRCLIYRWSSLWDSFGGTFQADRGFIIEDALRLDSTASLNRRLLSLNDQLTEVITDQDYRQLLIALKGTANSGLFSSRLALLALGSSADRHQMSATRRLTTLGEMGVSLSVREAAAIEEKFLQSMLLLVILMDQGTEVDELNFDVDREALFLELVVALKRKKLIQLLATFSGSRSGNSTQDPRDAHGVIDQESLLQQVAIRGKKFTLPDTNRAETASPIPEISRLNSTITGASLFTSFSLQVVQGHVSHKSGPLACSVVTDLLANGQASVAQTLKDFLPRDAWATYLKGRLRLHVGSNKDALQLFRRAAGSLSNLTSTELRDLSHGLIVPQTMDDRALGGASYFAHVASLFEAAQAWTEMATSLESALTMAKTGTSTGSAGALSEIVRDLFRANLRRGRFEACYSALVRWAHGDRPSLKIMIDDLVMEMYRADQISRLLSFPFIGLISLIDEVLSARAASDLGSNCWSLILYSWRLGRGDTRGAAEALWSHVSQLRSSSTGERISSIRPLLLLINTLSISPFQQGWILGHQGVDGSPDSHRSLMGVQELRNMYQDELDRIDDVSRGQFAFIESLSLTGKKLKV